MDLKLFDARRDSSRVRDLVSKDIIQPVISSVERLCQATENLATRQQPIRSDFAEGIAWLKTIIKAGRAPKVAPMKEAPTANNPEHESTPTRSFR